MPELLEAPAGRAPRSSMCSHSGLPSFVRPHAAFTQAPAFPPSLSCLLCLFTYGSGTRGQLLAGPQHPLWQLTEAPGQFAWPHKGPEAGELEEKGPGAGALAVVLEAPNARLRWPALPRRGGQEMGWGQGGMEESLEFSLEEAAVVSLLSRPSVPWLLGRPPHGPFLPASRRCRTG